MRQGYTFVNLDFRRCSRSLRNPFLNVNVQLFSFVVLSADMKHAIIVNFVVIVDLACVRSKLILQAATDRLIGVFEIGIQVRNLGAVSQLGVIVICPDYIYSRVVDNIWDLFRHHHRGSIECLRSKTDLKTVPV